jgi:hypothetical protein
MSVEVLVTVAPFILVGLAGQLRLALRDRYDAKHARALDERDGGTAGMKALVELRRAGRSLPWRRDQGPNEQPDSDGQQT